MDIEKIKKEYHDLGEKLTNPDLISDWERFQELSKKRAGLEKIVKKAQELQEVR
ncbi:PCRF domain-containing protein, partial [Patescibacteria group bacterium]|nr:PCRF domain-containing protein [Patescibacteria group bacterium]